MIRVSGWGLVCGFIIAATPGWRYFFLVLRFNRDGDGQEIREAAFWGFLTGQSMMSTSIYQPELYQIVIKPQNLILWFIVQFLVHFLWTNRNTFRFQNKNLLHPKVLKTFRRKGKRVLLYQMNFMGYVVLLLYNPLLNPDSRIAEFISSFLVNYKNNNKELFGLTSEMGLGMGSVVFMEVYKDLVKSIKDWIDKTFHIRDFENKTKKKKINQAESYFYATEKKKKKSNSIQNCKMERSNRFLSIKNFLIEFYPLLRDRTIQFMVWE